MDLKTILLVFSANILAIAVGLQRLDTQGIISLDRFLPYQILGQPCGHGRDDFYAVASDRIVLPTKVSSGASRFGAWLFALFKSFCLAPHNLGALPQVTRHQIASPVCSFD